MVDVATLRINVDTKDLEKSAAALTEFANEGGKVETRARAMAAQFSQFRKSTSGLTSEQRKLKAAVDPVYAAFLRYEDKVQDVTRAYKQGLISQRQYVSGLRQVRGALREGQQAASGFAGAIVNTRGGIQNVAFQVGDFATQVGAGTSASVALGQQLPQLLGGFGALGAVMGAVVAIGVPLGAALLGINKEGADLEEQLDDLTAALDALDAAQKAVSQSAPDLASVFGLDRLSDARERLEIAREAAEIQARLDLTSASETLGASLDPSILDTLVPFSDQFRQLAGNLDISRNSAIELRRALARVEEAQFPAQISNEVDRTRQLLIDAAGGMDGLNAAGLELLSNLNDMGNAADRLAANTVNARGETEAHVAVANQMISELNQQAEIQQLITRYGEDSVEVTTARVQEEREAFEATLETMQISADLADELLRAWDNANGVASVDMSGNITIAANEAARLAENLARAIQLAPITPAMMDEDAVMSQQVLSTGATREKQRQAVERFARLTRPSGGSKRSGGGRRSSGGRSGGGGMSKAQREAQRLHNERLRDAERITRDLETATESYNRELADLTELHGMGYLSADAYAKAVENLDQEFREAEFGHVYEAIDSISDAMADAIVNGESMGEALAQVFQQIARDLIASGIQEMLSGLFANAVGGGNGGGFLSNIFGGFRAEGGPVDPSKAYVVGERGPELFSPRTAGTIIPNSAMNGDMSQIVAAIRAIRVEANVYDDRRDVLDRLESPEGRRQIARIMREEGV